MSKSLKKILKELHSNNIETLSKYPSIFDRLEAKKKLRELGYDPNGIIVVSKSNTELIEYLDRLQIEYRLADDSLITDLLL